MPGVYQSKEKAMKTDERGNVDFVHLPVEEAENVIEAMEEAEKAADVPALKWCARRVIQLYRMFEDDVCSCDDLYIPVKVFNRLWETALKNDPPPESIAAIIAKVDEDKPELSGAAEAEKALDTLGVYFEENLGGRLFKTVSGSLDSLRYAVKKLGTDE
jgi:hypothetical protein